MNLIVQAVVFQTFVIVQVTYFILSGSRYLRVFQDLLMSQRIRSQSARGFRLIGSRTLKQQLLKYGNILSGNTEREGFCLLPSD